MGIGIIEVLLLHSFTLGNIPVPTIIRMFINLVFVQGFLFLSGMGIYYSLTKDSHLSQFYRKRVKRVLVPYMLIALPCYLFIYLLGQQNEIPIYSSSVYIPQNIAVSFLGKITTLAYWYEGNYNGMWYIALALVLYLLSPWLYRFIFRSDSFIRIRRFGAVLIQSKKITWMNGVAKTAVINWILVLLALKLFDIVLKLAIPEYYNTISFAIINAPFYIIGLYWGYLSYTKSSFDFCYILTIVLLYYFTYRGGVLRAIHDSPFVCGL